MTHEFELVQRFFVQSRHQFQRQEVLLGIGDDAAVLAVPGGQRLCVATDVLVAGVHFPQAAPAELVAHRSLAVNLSDMAAMGASPLCFTLGLTVPDVSEDWLSEFSKGLLSLARQFHCPLVGGDVSRGPLAIAIHIQGLVSEHSMIRREGAGVGDRIYVSGYLGDGALALFSLGLPSHLGDQGGWFQQRLSSACRKHFETAFYQPVPRVTLGQSCAPLVSSGIDLSDGLAGDLAHILRASSAGAKVATPIGARIDLDSLPYSPAAIRCGSRQLRQRAALFGGDDYELCFTVSPKKAGAVEALARDLDTPLTCVGEITATPGVRLENGCGQLVEYGDFAFSHFPSVGQRPAADRGSLPSRQLAVAGEPAKDSAGISRYHGGFCGQALLPKA